MEKKRMLWNLRRLFHEYTYFIRCLPNFIIIGNSFAGKTLLYNYLAQHRLILKNLREETAYFVNNYERGINWYKSNFPSKISKQFIGYLNKKIPLVGETINLSWSEVPKRVFDILPEPKIIVLLRNPVERTYARYLALVNRGIETLSFEDAIKRKEEPWYASNYNLKENKIYFKETRRLSLYLSRSIYVDDLKRWGNFFPKENWLVLKSEDLFSNPLETVNKTLKFLDLSNIYQLKLQNPDSKLDETKMNSEIRSELEDFFEPYNRELYDYLGIDLGWYPK